MDEVRKIAELARLQELRSLRSQMKHATALRRIDALRQDFERLRAQRRALSAADTDLAGMRSVGADASNLMWLEKHRDAVTMDLARTQQINAHASRERAREVGRHDALKEMLAEERRARARAATAKSLDEVLELGVLQAAARKPRS